MQVVMTPSLRRITSRSISQLFSHLISLLLCGLILVLLLGMGGGIVRTFLDLKLILAHPVEDALRQLLLDTLVILAVVEVLRTVLSYLSEGRVRVTFIVDTVLIVVLNETLSAWFKQGGLADIAPLLFTILTLIVVRLLAIRFSPDSTE